MLTLIKNNYEEKLQNSKDIISRTKSKTEYIKYKI